MPNPTPTVNGTTFTVDDADALTDDDRLVHFGPKSRGRKLKLIGLADDETPIIVTYLLSRVTVVFSLHEKGDNLHQPSGHDYIVAYANAPLTPYVDDDSRAGRYAIHNGETNNDYLIIDGERFDPQKGHAYELWARAQTTEVHGEYISLDGHDDGQPVSHQYEAFWLATKVETPDGTVFDRIDQE